MNEGLVQILVASIGLVGILGAALINRLGKIRELEKERETWQSKHRFRVMLSLPDVNKLERIIQNVFKKTRADRFVLFIGENGPSSPLVITNAVMDRHKDNMYMMMSLNAVDTYVNVNLDIHYQKMMKDAETTKEGIYLDVSKMQDSKLKGFYEGEMVKHSSVWFTGRFPQTKIKHFVLYYSFATHNEWEFEEREKTILSLAADKIRSLDFRVYSVKNNIEAEILNLET